MDRRAAGGGLQLGGENLQTLSSDEILKAVRANAARLPPLRAESFADLEGSSLAVAVRNAEGEGNGEDYDGARRWMFGQLWNVNGVVIDIYDLKGLETQDIPDAQGPNGQNAEHITPRSWGVEGTRFQSWLHNIAPTDTETNARRSNYPFGFVTGTVEWSNEAGAKLGLDERGETVFEPPAKYRGVLARMRLFCAIERGELDGTATSGARVMDARELATLVQFSTDHPPDADEIARHTLIAGVEGEQNPLVVLYGAYPDGQRLEQRLRVP